VFIKRWIYKRFLVSKAKLKKWFELENIRSLIQKEAEQDRNVSSLICSYLDTAICRLRWDKLSWVTVVNDYAFALNIHRPKKKYPIFSVSDDEESSKSVSDNSWYMWATLFADKFGWDLEYIAELDIDDAISLIQEILYSEQIRKEWEWGLSEKSTSYDKKTGKGKFVPYKRPKWMETEKELKPARPVKILKSMLPVGVIYGKAEDFKH
jgi:hypothetical protein